MTTTVIFLILCWFALTRTVSALALVFALAAAIVAMLAQRALFPESRPLLRRLLARPHHFVAFLGILAARLVQSTWYTSRVILFGREEGRIVALPSRLEDPMGQFILSHAITLTPSTISLLMEDRLHYIHWLAMAGETGDWRSIKESLEDRLARIFTRDRR